MEILSKRPKYVSYLLIIVGCLLLAVSIVTIYEPLGLVTGGFTGLAIVIKYYTGFIIEGGIPLWLSNIVLNVPLFIIALIIKGWRYIVKTFFGTICLSGALYIVPNFVIIQDDILLSAVFGGLIGGVGIGLILVASATTGGTELLAVIIQKLFARHHTVARIMLVLDGLIVVSGALVFGVNKVLYAVISVYITTIVTDAIIEGFTFAKLAYVISDEYEEIAEIVMQDLDRGVTGIHATGMYSDKDKKMLMCVVSKKEIIKLVDIVSKIDPKAFVIVSDVREVLGEGFIEYKQ